MFVIVRTWYESAKMTGNDGRVVVVVGSGPSGASAARQLVSRGIPVIMLEAGSTGPSGLLVRVMGRNVYRIKPDGSFGSDSGSHRNTGDPRTVWFYNLALGGLSNQWTGAVPRFAPQDFTEGQRLHDKYRWPISYAELEPYYTETEKVMGVVGSGVSVPNLPAGFVGQARGLPRDWRALARGFESHGQGLTLLPLADGSRFMLVRRGTGFNSYSNIVEPLLESPLFSLRTDARALRLEWSGAKRRVTAVVYRTSDGVEHRLEAAAFVLTAGPLNTTKLLFDSKCSDFPEGLGNSRDVLGRYLHDHPREWWVFETERPLSQLIPAAYVTRRPYDVSEPLLATSWTLGASSNRDKLLSFTPIKGRSFGVQVFGTMVPVEHYRVTPAIDETDELGLTKLSIHLRYDEQAVNTAVAARQHLMDLFESAGVRARLELVPPDQLIPGTSVHYGGTARMHDLPEFGVVDRYNRLFDAANVLVCDASCFTTGAEKNPTLTAMAIAARAADTLANDVSRS